MFDIGIIGAGPGGYSCAIRAAQKGLSVILFEKNLIGGTCLNRGCIPTKTILYSAKLYSEMKNSNKYGINTDNLNIDFKKVQERQKTVSEKIRKSLEGLIKSYGITIIEEEAEIEDEKTIKTRSNSYEVKNIIIATGSKPNRINFNGEYSQDFILTSDDILNMETLPNSIIIVGSGAIGIEWARILSAFNVKVTVLELMDKLIPNADYEVSERVSRIFKRNKIDFYTSATIEEIQGKRVKLTNSKELEADKILLGVGRITETDLGAFSKNLEIKKYINTDCNFRTIYKNIYAIGDVNGKSLLAHSAVKQAELVIDYILEGKCEEFNTNLVPAVIYGTPEIAFIGKTEDELKNSGIEYKKSMFPISALGKSRTEDKIEGFIKILADEKEILGAHIISEEASAMIGQIAIAMNNKISPKKLSETIFAHPSYSEGIAESMSALENLAINIPPKQII